MMTFVLTPRSNYNTIIEPRDCFLLSLMENLSIDFSSHMIVSIIDCFKTQLHMISSSFLWLSHASSHTCTSPFLPLLSSMSWLPLARSLSGGVQRSWLQSGLVWRRWMQPLPLDPPLPLPLLPPLGQMSLSLTSWTSFSL